MAGAAALLMGYRPDLTPLEVKAIILASVDTPEQLQNMYITGGRLNVSRMLEMALGDKLFAISVPSLAFDATINEMTFDTIQLFAWGKFPSRVYVESIRHSYPNMQNCRTELYVKSG